MDIRAATANSSHIFATLAVAASENHHIMVVDVGNAFLNAPLESEQYMRVNKDVAAVIIRMRPEYASFRGDKGELIVLLKRAL